MLEQQLAQGSRHMAVAGSAMAQAEQDIATSLDGFSQRLIGAAAPDSVIVKDAQAFQQELDRLKRDEVGRHLRVATASVAPAKAWADGLKQAVAPQLASARALNDMAERVRSTVLLVDDDGLQRKIVADILAGENCDLVFARGGIEALGLLRTTRPDLILMDVQMPVMDGIETTRRLKAAPGLAGIPVIMITGQSGKNTVAESIKAGAVGFVVKPFVRDTLVARVRQALRGI